MPTLSGSVIGQKYRSAISTYRKLLDGSLRLAFEQEADSYFRRCALGIWAAGSGLQENHVSAYNAICSGANRPAQVLYLELCAAVEDPPAFAPPGFYPQLLSADRGTARNRAGKFCDLCKLIFLLFAAADDPTSQRAVDYAADCVNYLRSGGGVPALPKEPAPAAQGGEQPQTQTQEQEQPKEPEKSLEELMEELNSLCGLEKVKKDVQSLVNLVKIRRLREEQGLPVAAMSLHLVFMGNPGTGKTTVARLLAGIYKAIGVLPKGKLVEVDRSGLVAGYVGQTAIQTQKVIQSALGGILFIDEAYTLASQSGSNDFGQEAIDTILKAMEDHRRELVVIVAGYNELMNRFIHSNPGLESRFNKYIYFDDYRGEELFAIFRSMCKKNGYTMDSELEAHLPGYFEELYENRDENFGNARDVRNLFEVLIAVQSNRVAQMEEPTREDLMALTLADFRQAEREENGGETGEETCEETAGESGKD